MIVYGRLVDANGEGLPSRPIEVVTPDGAGGLKRLASSKTFPDGTVKIAADLPALPAFGLLIDERPVLAPVASAEGDVLHVGTLVLTEAPQDGFALFHAPEGQVWGLPEGLWKRLVDAPVVSPPPPTDDGTLDTATPADGTADTTPDDAATEPASLGSVLEGTGAALSRASDSLDVANSSFVMGDVQLKVKGVAVAGSDGTMRLALVDTANLSAVPAEYLSELSVGFSPTRGGTTKAPATGSLSTGTTDSGTGTTPTPTGPVLPDLIGYTRELALRKLAARGLEGSVDHVAVDPTGPGARHVGRVVRQSPPAGAPLVAGTSVRLFIGLADRSS